jgi:hypothetical protein
MVASSKAAKKDDSLTKGNSQPKAPHTAGTVVSKLPSANVADDVDADLDLPSDDEVAKPVKPKPRRGRAAKKAAADTEVVAEADTDETDADKKKATRTFTAEDRRKGAIVRGARREQKVERARCPKNRDIIVQYIKNLALRYIVDEDITKSQDTEKPRPLSQIAHNGLSFVINGLLVETRARIMRVLINTTSPRPSAKITHSTNKAPNAITISMAPKISSLSHSRNGAINDSGQSIVRMNHSYEDESGTMVHITLMFAYQNYIDLIEVNCDRKFIIFYDNFNNTLLRIYLTEVQVRDASPNAETFFLNIGQSRLVPSSANCKLSILEYTEHAATGDTLMLLVKNDPSQQSCCSAPRVIADDVNMEEMVGDDVATE